MKTQTGVKVLTVEQVPQVLALLETWHFEARATTRGLRPPVDLLTDSALIALGSGCRMGQVLGLRRDDLQLTGADRAWMRIQCANAGFGSSAMGEAVVRSSAGVPLPSFASSAARQALMRVSREGGELLFPTRNGTKHAVVYLNGRYREFRARYSSELRVMGIEDPASLTPSVWRNTALHIIRGVQEALGSEVAVERSSIPPSTRALMAAAALDEAFRPVLRSRR